MRKIIVIIGLVLASRAHAQSPDEPPPYTILQAPADACRPPQPPPEPTDAAQEDGPEDTQDKNPKQDVITEMRDFELTRNGGFEYGLSGWLVRRSAADAASAAEDARAEASSSAAYIPPEVRASTYPAQIDGLGLELRLERDTIHEKVVSQSIDTPADISALRVRFRYRIAPTFPGGSLQDAGALSVSIQRVRAKEPLWVRPFSADLTQTVEATPLGDGWFQFNASVDASSALADMSASSVDAQSGPLLLRFSMAGQGMLLQLDDVSVQASGIVHWPDAPGRIAYAVERPGRAPGYAMHCVTPDGQHRGEFLTAQGHLQGLRWRPTPADNAPSELAFVSSHDPALSDWEGDFYLLNHNGLKRLTHPHVLSRVSVAGQQPKGRVRGQIQNPEDYYQTVQVHVQGAQSPAMLTLRPKETAPFVLDAVVDLGEPQFVVVRTRYTAFEAPWRVDVKANGVVDLPQTLVINRAYEIHSAGQPAWDHTGSGFVLVGERNQLLYLALGSEAPTPLGIVGREPRFSPVDDRLLYVATDPLQPDRERIWLWEREAKAPEPLVISTPSMPSLLAPAWLPDGSGFLYIMRGCPEDGAHCTSELHSYRFDGTNNKRLALFPDEEVSGLTLSPDGRFAAFIRAMVWTGLRPKEHRALWIMSLERPTMRWRMAEGDNPSFPDWSSD